MEKRYFTTLPYTEAVRLASKFLSKSWTQCNTSPLLREPYKFEFLFIEWRISSSYSWRTWRYYCPLQWNFWGIGGLYLSVVRGEGMMIDLHKRWNCQLHVGHPKFFPSILSHRGTCALYEYVHYWNINPYSQRVE